MPKQNSSQDETYGKEEALKEASDDKGANQKKKSSPFTLTKK